MAEGYDDEEHPIRDDGNEGRPGKQRYPGKLPNKGVAEGFGSNYAEQLAQEVFNHNPNIKDENQVLNLGYNISKNDLGRKAQGIFRDEDFPSDFVSAYFWLQKQGVTEGNRDLDAYEKDVRASQQGFGRPADHRGLGQELAHERNNLQVYINGKPWKVFPGRGYADSQEEFKFLQSMKAWAEKKSAATGKKWTVSLTGAEPTNEAQPVEEGRMGELAAQYDDYKTLSPREFFNLHKMTKQQWFEKYKNLLQQQKVAEANKKKDDDEGVGKVHDVALQRAISKSKAAFPTAQSGIQALMKSFAQDQEKDQDEFEKVRRADRRQDQLLAQISQVDKEQEKELQDLDKENDTLAQRLQQLQSVNSKLEKQLAAMSGRKKTKTTSEPSDVGVAPEPARTSKSVSTEPKAEPKSAPKSTSTAKTPNVSYKISSKPAKAKDADTDVIAPTSKKAPPGFGLRGADIQDIAHRMLDVPYKTGELEKTAAAELPALQNNPSPSITPTAANDDQKQKELFAAENKEEEADYGDEYQDMVARVGQKAKQQEKDKPVDIADLARRLAAIETSKKK